MALMNKRENRHSDDDLKLPSVYSSSRWQFTAILSLLIVAFLPAGFAYFPQLWQRQYYRFFPFALITTFVLTLARADVLPNIAKGWLHVSLMVLVFLIGQGIFFAGVWLGTPWLCILAFIVLTGLLLSNWSEPGTDRSLLYLVLPLVLILRPPLRLDETIIHSLQTTTSSISSSVLALLGIDHILLGNVIEPLVGRRLLVEEACSGVQSLFTLMFLASFIGVYQRYAIPRTILLIASSAFWALGMNVFRVIAIAIAQTRLALDLTSGWKHELIGYIGILIALALVISTDRLLAFAFGPIADDPLKHPKVNMLVRLWNWLFFAPPPGHKLQVGKDAVLSTARQQMTSLWLLRIAGIVSICIGVWGVAVEVKAGSRTADQSQKGTLPAIDESWLRQLPGSKLLSFSERLESSDVSFSDLSGKWTTETSIGQLMHVMDINVDRNHDRASSYVALGWSIDGVARTLQPEVQETWPVSLVNFTKPTGEKTLVCFSMLDRTGAAISSADETDFLQHFSSRLWKASSDNHACVQIRTIYESTSDISEDVIKEIVNTHSAARNAIKAQLIERFSQQKTEALQP